MAGVLQHQVESRVNDLYMKMQGHAQIIMRLSVEVDRLRQENEELKSAVKRSIQAVRNMERGSITHTKTSDTQIQGDQSQDIQTSHEISREYSEFSPDLGRE